jgi:hypothetical protein
MQWDTSANAGFSTAPKEKLYLPVTAKKRADTVVGHEQEQGHERKPKPGDGSPGMEQPAHRPVDPRQPGPQLDQLALQAGGIGQGREKARQFLKDNLPIANEIEDAIRRNAGLLAEELLAAGMSADDEAPDAAEG